MDLRRIVYASRPFGYDEATLAGILLVARTINAREGVTGALICRRDVYLQLLEGPSAAVAATYGRIRRDDRHVEVVQRVSDTPDARLFPDWDMLHDPAESWLWTEAEIDDGALDRAGPQDVLAIFERLAAGRGAAAG